MKILFLAPEPFFQERGTPIAVRLALQVLAKRRNDSVDLLTYHIGDPVDIAHLKLHRIWAPKFIQAIRPGISWQKILCDLIMLFTVLSMLFQRRKQQYDLIHAVEESVFIALAMRVLFGVPYIYDMDSSMALQLTEKWPLLTPILPLFAFFEKIAVKYSLAVVPVCDALAAIADKHGSTDTHILRDISLLNLDSYQTQPLLLKHELQIRDDELILLYIGNLEQYQGIDLLVDSFAAIADEHKASHLVIIGGVPEHIVYYKNKVAGYCLEKRIHITGPRPVSLLSNYLMQADILSSPRTLGNNTPMKIYSYLHSGKTILATRLPTHTQVLSDDVAMLSEATIKAFSQAMLKLFRDSELRQSLGKNAFDLAVKEYTFEVFTDRLNNLYDRVDNRLNLQSGCIQPE